MNLDNVKAMTTSHSRTQGYTRTKNNKTKSLFPYQVRHSHDDLVVTIIIENEGSNKQQKKNPNEGCCCSSTEKTSKINSETKHNEASSNACESGEERGRVSYLSIYFMQKKQSD